MPRTSPLPPESQALLSNGAGTRPTPDTDPETQRLEQLDHEVLLADHQAVSERIEREVDEMLAAAAEKRRALTDGAIDHLRAETRSHLPAVLEEDTNGDVPPAAVLLAQAEVRARADKLTEQAEAAAQASAKVAAFVQRVAQMEIELTRTRAERDELQALLEISENEREQALADLRDLPARAAGLDAQLQAVEAEEAPHEQPVTAPAPRPAAAHGGEEEAADLLVAAARAADDVRNASRARALRTLTKARDLAALAHAETERERLELAALQTRRVEAEREAEEILARAHAEAERVVAAIEDERGRARELLTGMLASLEADDVAPPETFMTDLSSRLHETADRPTS